MSALLAFLLFIATLCALRVRADAYAAFVQGAKEGLTTLVDMAPYLAAIMTATGLLRASGAMDALLGLLSPALSHLGMPAEAAPALLLRPLSGSAALAQAREVMSVLGGQPRGPAGVRGVRGERDGVLHGLPVFRRGGREALALRDSCGDDRVYGRGDRRGAARLSAQKGIKPQNSARIACQNAPALDRSGGIDYNNSR